MPNVKALRRMVDNAIETSMPVPDALDSFNNCLKELASVAKIPAKLVVPISGTGSIDFPTNMVKFRSITLKVGDTTYTQEESLQQYSMVIHDDQELEWTMDIPVGSNLTIRYYRVPTELKLDADIPEIPEHIHPALVHYAAKDFFTADDELELANAHTAQYLSYKATLKRDVEERGTTSVVVMDARPPWAR